MKSMIQEIFNALKELIFHNETNENQEVHDNFTERFGVIGKTQVEMIAMSPELNGQDKENPEDYFEGLGYSLPIAMYMMRRSLDEAEILEEQGNIDISESLSALDGTGESDNNEIEQPYQVHLDNNYEILVKEIKQTHVKFDDTLDPESISIPSQDFIENLTNKSIEHIVETDKDLENDIDHGSNNDTISQEL